MATELDWLEIVLRLGAATLAGMVIGFNRDIANKPIGMRTLGLVSLGAAVVALSTIHFQGMINEADALSRVLQGIVQGIMGGISFIGAGVILRDAKNRMVEGLTTAATVWITAAFGIACALAAWRIVLVATILALVLLFGAHVTSWVSGRHSAPPSS